MQPEDKPRFGKLLAEVLAGYGKALPDAPEVNIWFAQLMPFQPATIKRAFDAYRMERPDFAPVPNGIAARCKLLDGRPDDNEAWAIAITSQDESETVVWTAEMAEAFNLARPLLQNGDEIGARMAFKDAYKRLVDDARASNAPAVWSVSAGWDASHRQVAVEKAVVAGLLAGPEAYLALPNESDLSPERPEGLQRVMDVLAQLEDPYEKADRMNAERLAEIDEITRQQREEADRKTMEYFSKHPEARYDGLLRKGEGV